MFFFVFYFFFAWCWDDRRSGPWWIVGLDWLRAGQYRATQFCWSFRIHLFFFCCCFVVLGSVSWAAPARDWHLRWCYGFFYRLGQWGDGENGSSLIGRHLRKVLRFFPTLPTESQGRLSPAEMDAPEDTVEETEQPIERNPLRRISREKRKEKNVTFFFCLKRKRLFPVVFFLASTLVASLRRKADEICWWTPLEEEEMDKYKKKGSECARNGARLGGRKFVCWRTSFVFLVRLSQAWRLFSFSFFFNFSRPRVPCQRHLATDLETFNCESVAMTTPSWTTDQRVADDKKMPCIVFIHSISELYGKSTNFFRKKYMFWDKNEESSDPFPNYGFFLNMKIVTINLQFPFFI